MSIECGECERDLRGPHDWECSRVNPRRVRIREDVYEYPAEGVRLGPNVTTCNGTMEWTPVLWDDDEDPDWFKTHHLEFRVKDLPLEIDLGEDGWVDIHVDHEKKKARFEWNLPDRKRITKFPMRMISNLCSVLLREAGVSTFRFSARTGRHQVSVPKNMDVRDVAML